MQKYNVIIFYKKTDKILTHFNTPLKIFPITLSYIDLIVLKYWVDARKWVYIQNRLNKRLNIACLSITQTYNFRHQPIIFYQLHHSTYNISLLIKNFVYLIHPKIKLFILPIQDLNYFSKNFSFQHIENI